MLHVWLCHMCRHTMHVSWRAHLQYFIFSIILHVWLCKQCKLGAGMQRKCYEHMRMKWHLLYIFMCELKLQLPCLAMQSRVVDNGCLKTWCNANDGDITYNNSHCFMLCIRYDTYWCLSSHTPDALISIEGCVKTTKMSKENADNKFGLTNPFFSRGKHYTE